MSADKAGEIIKRAMADRSVYDAMAALENEVWGKILPEREQSDLAVEDIKAGYMLGISRHLSSLHRIAKKKGLTFEYGLTLGCGAGRCERDLISHGVGLRFHGIDISVQAVAKAREVAEEQDLPFTYEVADLNFVKLPEKTFDLVVAQTCLHHILFLEHIADEIWRSLKTHGYLWIQDFIGETQFQYDDKRLAIINQILAVLPEKLRKNTITGQTTVEIKRPEPGRLGSPFESIRSSEIIAVFQRWFTIEWKLEADAFLRFVVPPGTRVAYLENEDTKSLFEILMSLDQLFIKEGIVQPTFGQFLMRPRPPDEIPREQICKDPVN